MKRCFTLFIGRDIRVKTTVGYLPFRSRRVQVLVVWASGTASPPGVISTPGDTLRCLETFFIVRTQGRRQLASRGRRLGMFLNELPGRPPPQQRLIQPQIPIRKQALLCTICENICLLEVTWEHLPKCLVQTPSNTIPLLVIDLKCLQK